MTILRSKQVNATKGYYMKRFICGFFMCAFSFTHSVDVFVKGVRIPKDVKAIIFDHDNTIAKTEPLWMKGACKVLKHHGITLNQQQYKKLEQDLIGPGLARGVFLLNERFQLAASFEDTRTLMCSIVKDLYQTDLDFIPGFESLFARLSKTDIKTAIASNSDPDSLAISSQKLGLKQLFQEHMYCSGHVTKLKPAPDIYEYAARQLGVDPSACIAIEDSATGIEAAQRAGILCIGIITSQIPQMVANADLVIDSYDEITF